MPNGVAAIGDEAPRVVAALCLIRRCGLGRTFAESATCAEVASLAANAAGR